MMDRRVSGVGVGVTVNVRREIVSVATFHLRQTRGLADTQAQHPPFIALGSSFRIRLLIASFQGCQL